MIYINILTLSQYPNFLHQLDIDRYKDDFIFYENSILDIEWDMVVIYEGININMEIKVKKGGLLFISGEPPFSRTYTKRFLSQFDYIISSHSKLKHPNNILTQQALNWHFGFDMNTHEYKYDFGDLIKMREPVKTKNISVVTSSQSMLPGHIKRMKIIKILQENFPKDICFFGKDTNPIADKANAILPFRFHICMENSYISDYWTEKFADPVIGYSVPIYAGCKNISKYFNENSYIEFDINDSKNLCKIISTILEDPIKHYEEKLNYLRISRNKLLNVYNLFPTIVNHFERHKPKFEIIKANLEPVSESLFFHILNSNLRAKRYLYKSFSKYFRG